MKKMLLLIAIMIICALSTAFGQTFTLYTQDNSGLPYNSIYSIDVDRNGIVWFGGQKNATGVASVSTFNPATNTWKVYNQVDLALPEDRVYYMAEDTQGNMWFCTHYGFSVLRTSGAAEAVAFTDGKYSRTVQTDPNGTVYLSIRETDRTKSSIFVSNDFGATWGKEMFLPDLGYKLGPSAARPEIYDIRTDSRGWQWICTYFGVSYKKPDSTFKSLAAIEGQYTYAMTVSPNDHVWASDYGTTPKLYEIKPDLSIVTHDATTLAPLASKIEDLESDRNGHIWCALNGGGLLEIKPDGTYTQYTSASTSGAIPEDVLTHLEIINNEIWVSTSTKGILRISNVISSVEASNPSQPVAFSLQPNYPNPFNPSTQISFSLDKTSNVSVQIYDMQGRKVQTLASGVKSAGAHTLVWNGKDENGIGVPSGIYLCTLTADGQTANRKMTLVK